MISSGNRIIQSEVIGWGSLQHGGGRKNVISVLEPISRVEKLTRCKVNWHYVEEASRGDDNCYVPNLGKLNGHYPNHDITRGLNEILGEIIASQSGHRRQYP